MARFLNSDNNLYKVMTAQLNRVMTNIFKKT